MNAILLQLFIEEKNNFQYVFERHYDERGVARLEEATSAVFEKMGPKLDDGFEWCEDDDLAREEERNRIQQDMDGLSRKDPG